MSLDASLEERARAEASDPRWNVALEASAGTGKTRVLVDRYVRLVAEGVAPRHILAITFTRKAAGEMKTRIIAELRARPELWSRLRERIFDLNVATIDAFCLGLLKEFPLEAGLEPDVDLLDEIETHRLLEQAIDETLAATGGDVGFLLARFGDAALARGLRDYLHGRLVKGALLARFVRRHVPRDLTPAAAVRRAAEGLADAVGGELGRARLVRTGPTAPAPEWAAVRLALERIGRAESAGPLDVEQLAGYFLTRKGEPRKRLAGFVRREQFATPSAFRDHAELVLALAPRVAEVYARWRDELDRCAIRALFRLYRRAERRFAALKRARGGLDFADVLVRAVALLENRPEFSQSRFRLEARYHHLLIDEFQDTNEVQWRLVRALIASWGEGAGLVQQAILDEQAAGGGRGLVREPTIFLVGDRKQSIYGWRDARVEVLETAARHVLGIRPRGGRRLRIRKSFRATGTLLEFLNDVFAAMPKADEALPWAFRYGETDHFPVDEPVGGPPAVALVAATTHAEAAAAVADEIVRIVREEERAPKDVAILFRSRTHYRAYEEALVARGVPAYVYRGLGFFDAEEVRDVRALVRYLAEPASELRAAELARSRFVGVSDGALARIALASERRRTPRADGPLAAWLAGEGVAPRALAALSSEDRAAVERAAARVARWIERVDTTSPSELVEAILDETDYAAWLAGERGAQGWENLKKLLEMIRRAENRGYLTLSRLEEYLETASAGEESLAAVEALDAVNLMTIHAAKGLEFDTVFLVNLDQRIRTDASLPRIREHADGRVEIRALGRPEDEGPDRASEEEKRLLYVALTRARRRLVLAAARLDAPAARGSLLSLLPESLRQAFAAARTSPEPELRWRGRRAEHRLAILRPRNS